MRAIPSIASILLALGVLLAASGQICAQSAGNDAATPPGHDTRWFSVGAAADGSLSPIDTIDFQDVPVGQCSRERTVYIENNDSRWVSVYVDPQPGPYTAWFDSPGFKTTIYVPPHQSVPMSIRFCPQGEASATLDVVFRPDFGVYWPHVKLYGRGTIFEFIGPFDRDYSVLASGCIFQPITFENISQNKLTITSVTLDDPFAGFEIMAPDRTGAVIDTGGFVSIGVRYCADVARTDHTVLRVHYSGGLKNEVTTVLNGEGIANGDSLHKHIDFGKVPIGSCKRDSVVIPNNGSYALTLGWLHYFPPLPLGVKPIFNVVSPVITGDSIVIPSGASQTIVFEYCPTRAGIDSVTWVAIMEYRYPLQEADVDLIGEGIDTTSRLVWVDRNRQARVGEPVPLTVHLSADTGMMRDVRWSRVELSIDPTSLIYKRVITRSDLNRFVDVKQSGDTLLILTPAAGSAPLCGDTVVTLEFVGLSTGVYENTIKLRAIDVTGVPNLAVDSTGSILLIGCDVGRGLHLGLKGVIHSLIYFPGSGVARIRYRAPSGSTPTVSMLDLNGASVLTNQLPDGNGDDAEATLDISGLAPGFYIIQLRAGDDTSGVPILITE